MFAAVSMHAQTTATFATGTADDEAAIRAIVKASAANTSDSHVASNLDWENAFGVRYFDLKKRDAFYHTVVSPLQKDAADSTLEIKVKFLEPNVAVADEYWHIVGQIDEATSKPGADRWGRTTYIFKKQDGVWLEAMERVADLRLPYYHHYDKLPAPFAVAPDTLASYAGTYEAVRGRNLATVTLSGDRLQVNLRGRQRTAIPVSETEFLLFDPSDLADYLKLQFAKDPDGDTSLALFYSTGEPVAKAMKSR